MSRASPPAEGCGTARAALWSGIGPVLRAEGAQLVEQDPRGFFPPGDLRVSDAERDLAVSELSRAFQVGRLTTEEFQHRSEQAFAARTGNELTLLLADLRVERAPVATEVVKHDHLAPERPRVFLGATIAAACFALVAVANAF